MGSGRERGADGREGRLLVLRIDVRLLGEAARGSHDRLEAGEEIERFLVRAEGDLAGLATERLAEDLALADHHLGAALVQGRHERGDVDLAADRRDAHDAGAEVELLADDRRVVLEDLGVLDDPALDLGVRLAVEGEVMGQVDAARVVADVRLDRLVHRPTEVGGEVHAIARVGVAQEGEGVVVRDLTRLLQGAAQDLARRLGGVGPGVLRLRLDREPVEVAEHLGPVLPRVLVHDGDERVVAGLEGVDETEGHLGLTVVHREVDEDDTPPAPGRHRELVHGEGLGEDDLGLLADQPQNRGRGEDAVDAADRHDQIGGGEGGDDGLGHFGLQRVYLDDTPGDLIRLRGLFPRHAVGTDPVNSTQSGETASHECLFTDQTFLKTLFFESPQRFDQFCNERVTCFTTYLILSNRI